ncbi:DUF1266 domain-containing protein [Pseudomonas sp. NY15437]|uniref:DUF1266 domain-containing protein n=1 Tax=Pseudomonas sp. NY15437 TaxID=3400360 RepID=UPI003A869B54
MMGWILSGLGAAGLTALGFMGAWAWSRAGAPVAHAGAQRNNRVYSAGTEPLLCFGALMAACSVGDGSAPPHEQLQRWGIRDAGSARSILQDLFMQAQSRTLDDDFLRLQRKEPSAFDGEQRLRWKQARRAWSRAGLRVPQDLSMSAYELERIAWLARRSHACAYLDESAFWLTLTWVAEAARRTFTDWQAYAASFVLARAVLLREECSAGEAIRAFKSLLDDPRGAPAGLWRSHPLAEIEVRDVLLQLERYDAAPQRPSRDALLAFGALIATCGGARIDRLAIAPHQHEQHRQWLARHWQAADSVQVRKRLAWLLETGSRSRLDAILRQAANAEGASPPAGGQGSPAARYEQGRRALLKAGHDPECIDHCRSVLGYDLERAAFGARLAFSAGLLDEQRLWNALRHIARLARDAFESWEDYLVSVVLGHALANDNRQASQQLIRSATTLLDGICPFPEYRSPWQACSLARLPLLHSVPQAVAQ